MDMEDTESPDNCENSAADLDTTDMRLPCCLCWNIEQVGSWIESLDFHMYRVWIYTHIVLSILYSPHIIIILRRLFNCILF